MSWINQDSPRNTALGCLLLSQSLNLLPHCPQSTRREQGGRTHDVAGSLVHVVSKSQGLARPELSHGISRQPLLLLHAWAPTHLPSPPRSKPCACGQSLCSMMWQYDHNATFELLVGVIVECQIREARGRCPYCKLRRSCYQCYAGTASNIFCCEVACNSSGACLLVSWW